MLSFSYHPDLVCRTKREGTWPGWVMERDLLLSHFPAGPEAALTMVCGSGIVCLEKHRPHGSGTRCRSRACYRQVGTGTLETGCDSTSWFDWSTLSFPPAWSWLQVSFHSMSIFCHFSMYITASFLSVHIRWPVYPMSLLVTFLCRHVVLVA